jgi:hypothetical protein
MPGQIASWLVGSSYLLLGTFGYLSVRKIGTIKIVCGWVCALLLNILASNIYLSAEIRITRKSGTIQENQIQPDLPNLLTGFILFGSTSFISGVILGNIAARTKEAP